jgi:protein N-terminal methyltransferase
MAAEGSSMEGLARPELAQRQAQYWASCEPTIDGMLGGYGHIHGVDVVGSQAFIRKLIPAEAIARGRALDVGAGIGRITNNVLIPVGFNTVDLTDVSETFLQTARESVPADKLGDCVASSFDAFDFSKRKWTLIWMQWCAIYLRDDLFVDFFSKACAGLEDHPNSFVVLKENILRHDVAPIPDNEDHSVTRSDQHLKRLWAKAGVRVVLEEDQANLPRELFPVRMYALAPISRK